VAPEYHGIPVVIEVVANPTQAQLEWAATAAQGEAEYIFHWLSAKKK
jgi:hypothetical protein